jgi:hypothetical protein
MVRTLSLRELDWAVAEYVLEQFYTAGDEPPKYSKEIELAWPLVEKFKHFAPVVFKSGVATLGQGSKPVGGEWGCRFDCSIDRKENYVFGWGDTAAEAICRAVLECSNKTSGNSPP